MSLSLDFSKVDIFGSLDATPVDISDSLDMMEAIITTNRIIASYTAVADATFQFYKFFQINQGQVPILQTNMPLVTFVDLEAGSLQDLTNGFDIRVFDSSTNPIPYEVIDMVVLGDGSATFELWLNMPQVVDFEIIQLAFGKSGATDGSNPNAVYDSNYMGVYHLNQTSFGVGSIIDSTSNANDMDTEVPLSSIAGPVGKALSFGSEGHLDEGIPLLANMNDVGTVSLWINIDDLDDMGSLFRIFYSLVNGGNRWEALIDISVGATPNQLRFRFGGAIAEIEVDLPLSVFDSGEDHLFTFTWDQPNSLARIYIDGVIFATHTSSWLLGTTGTQITSLANVDVPLAFTSLLGSIDEARFSDSIRDSDWILTEFNNQNDNDAFWFRMPRLVASETHFLVDDLGNNIVTEIP